MPQTAESAKPALLDSMRDARKAQAAYAAIAALSAPAMLGVPVLTGVALLVVYLLERDRADTERLLADPPRTDFEIAVRAKRRRYFAGQGETTLDTAADQFALRALDVIAYMEATLRADERAQGARLAGDRQMERQRLNDAQDALNRAVEASVLLNEAADRLAYEWNYGGAGRNLRGLMRSSVIAARLGEINGSVDPYEVASPEARDYLERSGLVFHDLAPRPVVTSEDRQTLESDSALVLADRVTSFAQSRVRAISQMAAGDRDGGGPPSDEVFT